MINRIFSNGLDGDFVINPFKSYLETSTRAFLAAPYFTQHEPIVEAVKNGNTIQLLVGLNAATNPKAIEAVHGIPNLHVRFLTYRFHAKIFLFDESAMVGSSNLTDGGLVANREAVICLDQAEEMTVIEELRSLFLELWDSAHVLTAEKVRLFVEAHGRINTPIYLADSLIENAVGRAQPVNIAVDSRKRAKKRLFLEELRRMVYEQYLPAFNEVSQVLETNNMRRSELEDLGMANETNRFLNWVRLTHVVGDRAWQSAPMRAQGDREKEILMYGGEWTSVTDSKIPEDYVDWLKTVRRVFGSELAIEYSSRDDITDGLMSLHAFIEQLRFVKGGAKNLPTAFWSANNENINRVKKSLIHFVHGPGDFIERLHDILYDPAFKLKYFAKFCALELYGTVKPEECPPLNGRMAKSLRFMGFDVQGA